MVSGPIYAGPPLASGIYYTGIGPTGQRDIYLKVRVVTTECCQIWLDNCRIRCRNYSRKEED